MSTTQRTQSKNFDVKGDEISQFSKTSHNKKNRYQVKCLPNNVMVRNTHLNDYYLNIYDEDHPYFEGFDAISIRDANHNSDLSEIEDQELKHPSKSKRLEGIIGALEPDSKFLDESLLNKVSIDVSKNLNLNNTTNVSKILFLTFLAGLQ